MTVSKKISPQSNEALLSSADGFTAFSYGGYNIRFRAPYSLERYVDVVKWDNGYLVAESEIYVLDIIRNNWKNGKGI